MNKKEKFQMYLKRNQMETLEMKVVIEIKHSNRNVKQQATERSNQMRIENVTLKQPKRRSLK